MKPSAPAGRELPPAGLFWRWVAESIRPSLGWVLVGAGVLLDVVAYFGVSREILVARQLPYLVSGGIGGLICAGAGLVLIGREDRRRDADRLDHLEAVVGRLHDLLVDVTEPGDGSPVATVVAGRAAAGVTAGNGTGRAAARPPRRVLALAGGETYHRADCPALDGKAPESLSAAAARKRTLRPCPLCEPMPIEA